MILKTTLELFKGDGVYCTDHLDRSRLASRSYRLSNGSNRLSRIGTIHCKRLSITKTGMHGGTKARAVLSPVSDPAASLTKKRSVNRRCILGLSSQLILSVVNTKSITQL
uniref:Uncharacterized protein n=1 Tax=Brassica oleracea var. oleracea TaxID=109376 RepID=A0A0D3A7X1_BRAOL